jgi:hypothetical protein
MTYLCPFCESVVRVGKPCPKCRPPKVKAKRAKRSWEQDSSADGLDLPEEEFDYDAYVAREFGKGPHHQTGMKWYWWVLAVAVLAAMLGSVLWMR